MGNFDFLLKHECFNSFSVIACSAEKMLGLPIPNSPNTCLAQCRQAAEAATKWIYNHDKNLPIPENASFNDLASDYRFRQLVGSRVDRGIYCIRKFGNIATHKPETFQRTPAVRPEDDGVVLQAQNILNFLFVYLDWIAQTYVGDHEPRRFNRSITLINQFATPTPTTPVPEVKEDKTELKKAAAAELQKFTECRKDNSEKYKEQESDISEFETRKFFIDTRLTDVGWTFGVDWKNEVNVTGVSTPTGEGYLDYVLYDDDGTPLALVEAKKLSVDPEKGRIQAITYAKAIEKQYGVKVVIFLANGKEIRMFNDGYPERPVSSFFSKEDLRAIRYKQKNKTALDNIEVPEFCSRTYQFNALKSVCEHFSKNFRKSLVVMATGTGKTRTIMGLIKILTENNWAKNILFLADRNILVDQAYKAAKDLLKSYSASNISPMISEKYDLNARIIFSTYQTMIGKIDEAKTDKGAKLFSPGHFDLIISDECHRSIYNRYRSIFEYFDGLFVGLTATPKSDIDINTYKAFGLDNNDPTFNYSLKEAVNDGYLVPYRVLKFETDFIDRGIKYDDLSEDEKEQWEDTFTEDDGSMLKGITAGELNKWVINTDTIKLVINKLMTQGIRIKSGSELGKTIIFAKSHKHAEAIRDTFYKLYPHVSPEFCQVIDHETTQKNYAVTDDFKDQNSLPQIAVSVDMLDTGFDVPSCLNLVFFKPVFSKSKFWQMIGRGTRLCPGLINGKDKTEFLIIDCCKNFEYFMKKVEGRDDVIQRSLDQKTFLTRLRIVKLLQDIVNGKETENDETRTNYLNHTIDDLCNIVKNKISAESFAAYIHANALDDYSKPESYKGITDDKIKIIVDEIVSLIPPCAEDNIGAKRFDLLIYNIERCKLDQDDKTYALMIKRLQGIASDLIEINADAIKEVRPILKLFLQKDFCDKLSISEWEKYREMLRSLMAFIGSEEKSVKYIDISDTITVDAEDATAVELIDSVSDMEPYDKRVKRYLLEHEKEGVIAKLKNNIPMTENDFKELEDILWNKVGTKEESGIEKESELGLFVRKIVGLTEEAVTKAFAKFVSDNQLTEDQRYFLERITQYVVKNGVVEFDSPYMLNLRKECPLYEVFPVEGQFEAFNEVLNTIRDNALYIPGRTAASNGMEARV